MKKITLTILLLFFSLCMAVSYALNRETVPQAQTPDSTRSECTPDPCLVEDGTPILNTPTSGATMTPTPLSHKYHITAYFPEWGVRDGYYVKNIEAAGSASKLTLINYAFGIPMPEPGSGDMVCQVELPRYAYQQAYTSSLSIDGMADEPEQPLRGHFNQLKKLKQKYPQIKVVVSLGGWTGSKNFSLAARTPESREKFVASCIDLYVHGNLPESGKAGGPGAAAGVFDGIDIDWEFPVIGGDSGTLADPADGENFVELLKEFRRQFELAGRPDFLLTIAGPAAQDVAHHLYLKESAQYLDLIQIMTYDFHGTWSSAANHHTNLCTSPDDIVNDERRSSTDRAVRVYRDVFGVPAEKIIIGAAFYGRAWRGVADTNNGLYQPGEGFNPGGSEFARLKDLTSQGYTRFWDDQAKAPWLYNPTEQIFWTYDDPESVLLKAQYARVNNLAGVMFWEITGDDSEGTLVSTLYHGLEESTTTESPCP
jgi:chitinase